MAHIFIVSRKRRHTAFLNVNTHTHKTLAYKVDPCQHTESTISRKQLHMYAQVYINVYVRLQCVLNVHYEAKCMSFGDRKHDNSKNIMIADCVACDECE